MIGLIAVACFILALMLYATSFILCENHLYLVMKAGHVFNIVGWTILIFGT